MRRLRFRSLAAALALLLGTASAAQADPATVALELGAELWLLNGDSVRQPNAPLTQPIAFAPLNTTTVVVVSPGEAGPTDFTRLFVPDDTFRKTTLSLSRTSGGAPLSLINPTNRFDPFTLLMRIRFDQDAGTFRRTGGGAGGVGGPVVLNLDTRLVMDRIPAGGEFFVADLPLLGGIGATASPTFTGSVATASIPLSGAFRGRPWTTGTVRVTRTLITRRENDDPAAPPTGFVTFMHTAMGSLAPDRLSLVTPVVIDLKAGVGPNTASAPIYGSFRLTLTPEPGATALLVAGVMGLLALGLRARRPAHCSSSRLPARQS